MKWFFDFTWLYMITFHLFSCVVLKKVLLLKYRKWVGHLKNRYHFAKVVENARINFSITPYCTPFFSRKENFKFFEVALSAVFFAMAQLVALSMCEDINIEILPIPLWTCTCFSKTAIKALKQGVKFVQI